MSDKPTGEWTVERLSQYAHPEYSDLKQLASAIHVTLAAEREKLREERAKFHGDDYADMDAARNRILDLEQQLAAEREKVRALVATLRLIRNGLCNGGGPRGSVDRIDAALAKVKQ